MSKRVSRKIPKRLFMTDPWDSLGFPNDTTLRIMQESKRLGERAFISDVNTVQWKDGKLTAVVRELKNEPESMAKDSFIWSEEKRQALTPFDQLFYRADPPVDLAYLFPLQLMKLAELDRSVEIVNPLSALFSRSEKLECLFDPKFTPRTLITSEPTEMLAFLKRESTIVVKPMNTAQSRGVAVVKTPRELKAATQNSTTEINSLPFVLQSYHASILQGEKRTWWVDGKLLAFAQKVPKTGQSIINMDQGGSVQATPLSAREKRALPAIAQRLKASKIRLAAIDLIDGLVTDYNFTSPGLLIQMEQVLGENLAKKLLTLTRP
ncbi:MAG: hypothetical protein EOP09_18790 [Proteobacteria bacterium]|nr:MAG: hypothetical protein EOP09_18790 [Pseudomonadota bacterium]